MENTSEQQGARAEIALVIKRLGGAAALSVDLSKRAAELGDEEMGYYAIRRWIERKNIPLPWLLYLRETRADAFVGTQWEVKPAQEVK